VTLRDELLVPRARDALVLELGVELSLVLR